MDEDFILIDDQSNSVCSIGDIGFRIIEDFMSAKEMEELLEKIELGNWKPDLENKRVQIFGYVCYQLFVCLD